MATDPTHIAHALLLKSHPPPLAASLFADKVLHKPLHLRPTSPDPTSHDARAKRRTDRLRKREKAQRRQKVKPLSAKEKRDSGVYEIPDGAKKYEIYVPLQKMWVGYMWEVLGMKEGGGQGFVSGSGAGGVLASADYHGAEVTVVRSRCVGMVGLAGIVVRDTKFTFQIITKKNQLKTIPKMYTIFRFEIPQPGPTPPLDEAEAIKAETKDEPPFVFELHGSHFMLKAPERATKRFKQRNLKDL